MVYDRAIKVDDVQKFEMLYYLGFEDLNKYLTFDGKNFGHLSVQIKSEKILSFLLEKTNLDFCAKDKRGFSVQDFAKEIKASESLISKFALLKANNF